MNIHREDNDDFTIQIPNTFPSQPHLRYPHEQPSSLDLDILSPQQKHHSKSRDSISAFNDQDEDLSIYHDTEFASENASGTENHGAQVVHDDYMNSEDRLMTEPTVETPLHEPNHTDLEFGPGSPSTIDQGTNFTGDFTYERSNATIRQNPTQLFISEFGRQLKSYVTGFCRMFWKNKLMSFMCLQLLFIILRSAKLLSPNFVFYVVLFTGVTFILVAITNCVRRARRHYRMFNRYNGILNGRRNGALGNSLRRHEVEGVSTELINRIIMNEVRLSHLRNQLEVYLGAVNPNNARVLFDLNSPLINYLAARDLLALELGINTSNPPQPGLAQVQIDNLPVETYKVDGDRVEEGDGGSCTICLDDLKENDQIRIFGCGHKFHKKCVDDWLLLKNLCPNCKHVISSQ